MCTAFADNDIGRLLEDFILQGGVGTEFIKWVPYDGVGRTVRNGLNFTERGFGVRGAVGIPDRGHSAASQLRPGDFDWDHVFGQLGARWLHTGGIFAALSDTTPKLVIEAVQAARKHGVIVSYDLNYRPSLWKSIGGQERAREVNREIARQVDVMIGNEEDFTACLGFKVEGADEHLSRLEVTAFQKMIRQAVGVYPNFKPCEAAAPGCSDSHPEPEGPCAAGVCAQTIWTDAEWAPAPLGTAFTLCQAASDPRGERLEGRLFTEGSVLCPMDIPEFQ